ncbi:MAG: hypothetical protein NT018_01370 [Armatimonadetes bacterium]|nr:hypothetical protein [Armatimonadota bacterium]
MRKTILLLLVIIALGASGGVFAAAGEKGIAAPPALHIPYGGKVVTDVNISEGDVLGVIKQVLPAIADQVKAALLETGGNAALENVPDLTKIDLKPLLDSISGVKNVRLVVVKYGKNATAAQILKQANAGVAKIGRFKRVVMHSEDEAASMALYCQEDNGGFVGFAYNSRERTLIAARVVGPVDVAKLIEWASSVGIQIPSAPAPSSEPGQVEPQIR